MNPQLETKLSTKNSLANFCVSCARKVASQIQNLKNELISQFRGTFSGNERMLRLVLNEAEALAFSTDYPQLFFPTLALEKVRSAVVWQRHQAQLRTS
jgi:hypothetical protein